VEDILSNLSDYAPTQENISVRDVLEDNQLEISEKAFEGEATLEPRKKFLSADSEPVYVFNSSSGLEFVGNKAMIDINLPEYIPSIY
jgi:hypothetical protein